MASRTRVVAGAALPLLIAVPLLAGCGSSSAGSATSPADTLSSSPPSSVGSPTAGGATSSGTPSAASTTTGSTAAATITIKNFAYNTLTVAPGATITVVNKDAVSHTVTADNGSGATFDVNVPGSGSASLTAPTKPGSYAYHCNYHANMHGTLTVQG